MSGRQTSVFMLLAYLFCCQKSAPGKALLYFVNHNSGSLSFFKEMGRMLYKQQA